MAASPPLSRVCPFSAAAEYYSHMSLMYPDKLEGGGNWRRVGGSSLRHSFIRRGLKLVLHQTTNHTRRACSSPSLPATCFCSWRLGTNTQPDCSWGRIISPWHFCFGRTFTEANKTGSPGVIYENKLYVSVDLNANVTKGWVILQRVFLGGLFYRFYPMLLLKNTPTVNFVVSFLSYLFTNVAKNQKTLWIFSFLLNICHVSSNFTLHLSVNSLEH